MTQENRPPESLWAVFDLKNGALENREATLHGFGRLLPPVYDLGVRSFCAEGILCVNLFYALYELVGNIRLSVEELLKS